MGFVFKVISNNYQDKIMQYKLSIKVLVHPSQFNEATVNDLNNHFSVWRYEKNQIVSASTFSTNQCVIFNNPFVANYIDMIIDLKISRE